MIHIDKIGFTFRSEDEDFSRNMYVRWDNYYHNVIHALLEEFLSCHDVKGELLQLEQLNLNLGSIPQEEFYHRFPLRLKEELEKVFLYHTGQGSAKESTSDRIKRRMATLSFYLEKGFCPTVWEEAEFNLEKEIRFLLSHAPEALARLFHHSLRQPGRLRRLIWGLSEKLFGSLMLAWLEEKTILQKEKETQLLELGRIYNSQSLFLHKVMSSIPAVSEEISILFSEGKDLNYISWLLNTTLSLYEKRRSLAAMLESSPVIVVRFIHETQDEKHIRTLASLLDIVMVKQIINAECENHTEIDVPAYWMHLYNWLIKYYPFNGIYMFGSKLQFKEYLNVKLLHFIRKRPYSTYLSKTELTMQFLIEVFGKEYYLILVNIIYHQQARNEDGTPAYADYFNMELYYMFQRLSLIQLPLLPAHLHDMGALDTRTFMLWLADKQISPAEKRSFLTLLAKTHLPVMVGLIKEQSNHPEHLSLLAEFIEPLVIYEMASSLSFSTTEWPKLTELLQSAASGIRWLSGIMADRLTVYIHIAMLRWIGSYRGETIDAKQAVTSFLILLYREISGNAQVMLAQPTGELEETMNRMLQQMHLPVKLSPPTQKSIPEEFITTIEQHPEQILSLMRKWTAEGMVSIEEWSRWFDNQDWIRVVSVISIYKAELLQQIIEYLFESRLVPVASLRTALIRFLIEKEPQKWIHEESRMTVKRFVQSLRQTSPPVEEMTEMIIEKLSIADIAPSPAEQALATVPEYLFVGNAGLVLLSPWFPRLFDIVGLLNEEKKDFKDIDSRLRALFMVQRLVTSEDREYEEKELAFNRILVNCPFTEPLPAKMELSPEELQTIESMLEGVKNNWTKIENTSIRGFQHSFIERSGHLEQTQEKWLLTVDPRSYDMLLDSIPWSYTRIRFSWLRKEIEVDWRRS